MRLNLWGDNDEALSVSAGVAENINCYLMPSEGGVNSQYLTGAMGATLHATLNVSSASIRGCWSFNDIGYVVAFDSLYSVELDGTVTNLGAVPGSDMVGIVDDGTYIIVFNGTLIGYYYNTSTAVFSTVVLPFAGYTATTNDGYLIVSSSGHRFFISAVNDSTSFNALDFASAEKSPDDLLSVWEDHGEVIMFGSESIEVWFNSAETSFPFSRNPSGLMERGSYGRFSVCRADNTLYFLADDLTVCKLEGFNPVKVSSADVDIKLSGARDSGYQSDLANATMYSYTEHGHKFVHLNIPNRFSTVLNIATGQWHTAKHYDYATSMGTCYFKMNSRHFIGGLDGKIYEMSRNYYSDAGRPFKRGRVTNYFADSDKRMRWKYIKFVMNVGETPVYDETQGTDPLMVLKWSDDGGHVFKNEKHLALGRAGRYNTTVIKRSCGSSRRRTLEFYVTDPVPFIVLDATAEIL